MRSALFWGVSQRRVVIVYRRFGTTYRSHLQVSRSPRSFLKFLTLEDPKRRYTFTALRCVISQKSAGKFICILSCRMLSVYKTGQDVLHTNCQSRGHVQTGSILLSVLEGRQANNEAVAEVGLRARWPEIRSVYCEIDLDYDRTRVRRHVMEWNLLCGYRFR
jgi:hypothetical protein